MYTLSVARDFQAQHYLTVPEPGPEGEPHGHPYRAEVCFTGAELNEYGYLVDIEDVDAAIDGLVARYEDTLLNDLAEFDGLNPSVERFAQVFCDGVVERAPTGTPTAVAVRMWEGEDAWASYEREC